MVYNFVKKNVNKFLHFFKKVNPSPVIVLGNQKSGTSVIAHLLADVAGLSKTIDIPESWWPALKKLLSGKIDLSDFVENNRHRFSKDLIKEPNFTFLYSELRKIFPDARFVIVVRDPRDNIRSLLNRMKIPGDLERLNDFKKNIPQKWKHIFNTKLWGIRGDSYIEILAKRWNLATQVYLKNSDEIELIFYEDFINDKVLTIQNLALDLELKPIYNISKQVDIQYQPRGNRDVKWKEFFGTGNLKLIEEICSSYMTFTGYKTMVL